MRLFPKRVINANDTYRQLAVVEVMAKILDKYTPSTEERVNILERTLGGPIGIDWLYGELDGNYTDYFNSAAYDYYFPLPLLKIRHNTTGEPWLLVAYQGGFTTVAEVKSYGKAKYTLNENILGTSETMKFTDLKFEYRRRLVYENKLGRPVNGSFVYGRFDTLDVQFSLLWRTQPNCTIMYGRHTLVNHGDCYVTFRQIIGYELPEAKFVDDVCHHVKYALEDFLLRKFRVLWMTLATHRTCMDKRFKNIFGARNN